MSPSAIQRTACQSVAFGALLLTAATVSAQPTLTFQDSQSATPGVYQAGDSFNLDLILSFTDGELAGGSGFRAVGATFDLAFAQSDGSSASSPLTLVSRDLSESPFDDAPSMGPFDLTSVIPTGADARDLGATASSFASDAGVGPGDANIGIYSFSSTANLDAGFYRIDFDAPLLSDSSTAFIDTEATGTSFNFQVVAIPEPTSLALLLPAVGLGLARRRR